MHPVIHLTSISQLVPAAMLQVLHICTTTKVPPEEPSHALEALLGVGVVPQVWWAGEQPAQVRCAEPPFSVLSHRLQRCRCPRAAARSRQRRWRSSLAWPVWSWVTARWVTAACASSVRGCGLRAAACASCREHPRHPSGISGLGAGDVPQRDPVGWHRASVPLFQAKELQGYGTRLGTATMVGGQ